MRKTVSALLAGLAAGLSASAEGPDIGSTQLLNGISVIVNNEVITEQQIERSLYERLSGQSQVPAQQIRQLRSLLVEQMVQSKLVLADFAAQGYQLPETYVDDYINDQIREEFGDSINFAKTLKEIGQTREQFRQDRKDRLIQGMMQRQMIGRDKIVISPARIEAYYKEHLKDYQSGDQVKLRMISINQPAGAPKGMARRIAEEVHTKLLEGAPFAQMASVYSDGSARTTGGDRGWVNRDFLNKELSEVAFNLKPGELSPVVDLPGGAYILYVEEARIDYTRPLADVQGEIESELRGQEQQRLEKKWIDRLKQKNFVRYF
jgi:peptidyl-prolyl cis-trans isomerase SurA